MKWALMKRESWFALVLGVLTVLVILLLVLAALPRLGIQAPGLRNLPDGMFLEHPEQTLRFDPVSGYRLTTTASRGIRIDDGSIEYEVLAKGNNQGFFDGQDFYPPRADPGIRRIAVFGDSFSAQMNHRNWTDTVEWLSAQQDGPHKLELLNFSQDACGLANWRNVIVHELDARDYQVDLLVFAVFGNDLDRPFTLLSIKDGSLAIGQAGWDPAAWPASEEQARRLLVSLPDTHAISTRDYDLLLAGQWRPQQERHRDWKQQFSLKWGAWKNFLAGLYFQHVAAMTVASNDKTVQPTGKAIPDVLRPEQKQLIMDIRAVVQKKHIPVYVVRVPHRDELVSHFPVADGVVQFASLLDAHLLDGSDAFAGLGAAQLPFQYFPHDGHWSKAGADRFADYMYRELDQATTASR